MEEPTVEVPREEDPLPQDMADVKEQQQPDEPDEAQNGDALAGAGAAASANCQLPGLEGKPGPFSSVDSSIDILKKKAQELIENINENRQRDQTFMTNFKDNIKIKVSDLTEKLEEKMYQMYSDHSKIIEEKLQEFTQKMSKISHLEMELKQVCHTVETMYKDLCVHPEAPASEEQNYNDGEC